MGRLRTVTSIRDETSDDRLVLDVPVSNEVIV